MPEHHDGSTGIVTPATGGEFAPCSPGAWGRDGKRIGRLFVPRPGILGVSRPDPDERISLYPMECWRRRVSRALLALSEALLCWRFQWPSSSCPMPKDRKPPTRGCLVARRGFDSGK
jgi:hypothetical protein